MNTTGEKNALTKPDTPEISGKKIHSFAMGNLGIQIMMFVPVSYLMIYYTDVIGVSMTVVSLLLLGVRIFDAVNDPIIGTLADRTHSRWGRYRPWLMFGGILVSVFSFLLFACSTNFGSSGKILWMCVFYVLATVCATCVYMAHTAMPGVLTSSSSVRTRIASLRTFYLHIGYIVVGIVMSFMLNAFGKNVKSGYFWCVLLLCVISMPLIFLSGALVKETYVPAVEKIKVPVRTMLKTISHNKYVIIIMIGTFVYGISAYGRLTAVTYYFTYNIGNPGLAGMTVAVTGVAGLFGALIIPKQFLKYFSNRGKAAALSAFLNAACLCALFFLRGDTVIYWVIRALSMVFQSGYCCTVESALPDTADCNEYKTGFRMDGFVGALYSFMMKFGGAVATVLTGFIINAFGYVPNVEQTATSLRAINASAHLLPGAALIISGLAFLLFYDLSIEKRDAMRGEILKKREEE